MKPWQRAIGSSKADLAIACSYWLRDEVEWTSDEVEGDNLPRDIGIAFHELVSRALGGAALERFHTLPAEARTEALARFAGWTKAWDEQGLEVLATEQCWIVDVRTLSFHLAKFETPEDFHSWRKGRKSWELPVIVDLVVRGRDGSVGVIDIKTGRDLMVAPNRSAQLLLGALVTGATWVGFHYITDTGSIRQYAGAVKGDHNSEMSADATIEDLSNNLTTLSEPTPGEHCTKYYCPAFVACPGIAQQVADLIPVSALARRAPKPAAKHFGITSSDGLQAALDAKKMGEKMLKSLDAAIKAYATQNPELPNGKVYRPKPQTKVSFDKSAFLEALDTYRSEHPDCPDLREFNKSTTFDVWRVVKP